MGLSLDQVFEQARAGDSVGMSLVTNQDNGICSYATGSLLYYPPSFGTVTLPISRPARLSTTGGVGLTYLFSDRMLDVDPPSPPGGFGHSPRQPFSVNAVDKLGLSISRLLSGPPIAKFTLLSWDNVTFSVSLESKGNELVGLGPSIGNQADHAVYVFAFTGIAKPPRKPA